MSAMTFHAPFASKAILTDEPRSWEEIKAETVSRAAEVVRNELYAGRGMPWEVRTYGAGRCTIGRGVPGYYRNEQHARAVAKCWIETGVSPADQSDARVIS